MTDKLSIDEFMIAIDAVTAGKIQALVDDGKYQTHDDFLNDAIGDKLQKFEEVFDDFKIRKSFAIGLVNYSAKELQKHIDKGRKLDIKVIGGLRFSNDVTTELVEQSINKIMIAGTILGGEKVKQIANSKRYTISGKKVYQALKV